MNNSIGIIGTGLMGSAISRRLHDGGFTVLAWDRDGSRLEAVPAGQRATDADEIFAKCGPIVLCLPDSNVVASVLNDRALRANQIIIDTSTGSPESSQTFASKATTQGAYFLDATISGSSAQVLDGSCVVMAGGAREAFDQCRGIFAAFSSRAFHTGASGSGAKMKLVTNLVLGLNRAALAEGLAFAQELGLDPALTLEIMRGSMAYSRIMDTKGEKMIHAEFTPQARLSQHLKDVRLILAATGKALPLTNTHRELLEKAESLGCGDLDNSAIIKAYE